MSRTESIVIQVHPKDEQNQIDLMQRFHWEFVSTQEIKTIDNHLERRGDTIYQVTNSEHYVKLAFSRRLDTPNLDEIKALESEYFALSVEKPESKVSMSDYFFPFGGILFALIPAVGSYLALLFFIGGYVYVFTAGRKDRAKKREEYRQRVEYIKTRMQQIMIEIRKFD